MKQKAQPIESKEEQKKLLVEIMDDDQKTGLYDIPKTYSIHELREACLGFMAAAIMYKENNANIGPMKWLDENYPI